MHGGRTEVFSGAGFGRHGGLPAAWIEKRRRYNRLYMRSWRADPAHRAADRANRAWWHYQRKLRKAVAAPDVIRSHMCGFCRRHPPVRAP